MRANETRDQEVVCLVEDDKTVLSSIDRLLGSDGLAARAFDDPESFLEYVKTHSVPVVVLDIWMEHMTGLAVQARVAKVSPHTRVIIMTGREEPEADQIALKLGAIAFFTKPFDDEAFLVAVRGALFSALKP